MSAAELLRFLRDEWKNQEMDAYLDKWENLEKAGVVIRISHRKTYPPGNETTDEGSAETPSTQSTATPSIPESKGSMVTGMYEADESSDNDESGGNGK